MAKIVFRVVPFSKRRKRIIYGRERRFGCDQVALPYALPYKNSFGSRPVCNVNSVCQPAA